MMLYQPDSFFMNNTPSSLLMTLYQLSSSIYALTWHSFSMNTHTTVVIITDDALPTSHDNAIPILLMSCIIYELTHTIILITNRQVYYYIDND